MLIEFSVTNFRSIREKQTLSLVASGAAKDLPSCVIEPDPPLPGMSGLKFLKGAAIYGANASGKSNVIKAMRFLSDFVTNSATGIKPGAPTGTEPFKLDRESLSQPSRFEITFVAADGVRYLFGLSLTAKQVTEEYLVAYPKGTPQRWYHRTFNETTNSYDWARPSASFKHDKTLQDKTRENSLFLSVGPQFNHPQLTPVLGWFKSHLHLIVGSAADVFLGDNSFTSSFLGYTASLFAKASHHDRIIDLLKSADIGIVDGRVEEKDFEIPDSAKSMYSAEFLERLETNGSPLKIRKIVEVKLLHKGDDSDSVDLDFMSEESAGTQRLFALIGPWTDILDRGLTVFIDEIEASLHPILVRNLLSLIFSAEHNPNGAQVIFTTHSPVLLDNTLMRRDQIWFTEKAPTGATRLYPLTDYQPRRDEALAKGYLAGRYGAIPYLPDGLKL
jgi:AAA15 family ATPase/GTPase